MKMKTINKYSIIIDNLNYKGAMFLKKFLSFYKITAKIKIINKANNKLKYICHLSKFDK